MKQSKKPKLWALVPAAGSGARMGADVPKQYLQIGGKAILQLTLETLLSYADIEGVQVCLAPEDPYWSPLAMTHAKLLPAVDGGATRADSVIAGLNALSAVADDQDWVLVHDAARPCLTHELLERLTSQLGDHDVGGLLALPIVDTIKQSSQNNEVVGTVARDALWTAQTPQMFRLYILRQALSVAVKQEVAITDESSAVEKIGLSPQLVLGDKANGKVTYPGDERWVEYFLSINSSDD